MTTEVSRMSLPFSIGRYARTRANVPIMAASLIRLTFGLPSPQLG
jgi:hypothetical protein